MGLQLPANFKNDIQGRDTNLFPVVVIGSWTLARDYNTNAADFWTFLHDSIILSTIPFTLSDDSSIGELRIPFKPILLNVPSLKESIDIEKRNYKISNINIDISNFPHDGKRFSDIIAKWKPWTVPSTSDWSGVERQSPVISQSLINVECRIYWWSPSVEGIGLLDLATADWHNRTAMQVYNGVIRRYTHDDEKVRLVVEDRSQGAFHTELPLPENYLKGNNVPDKYKNKPIPMVYGHVDKSPLVRYVKSGKWILQADSSTPSFIADNVDDVYGIGNYDQLYIYTDESYISIIKENQFNINTDKTIELISLVLADPANIIDTSDELDCYYYLKPRLFNIYTQVSDTGVVEETALLEEVSSTEIFFDNDLATSHTFNVTTNQADSNTNDEYHWLITIPVVPNEITFMELLDYDVRINGVLMPDHFSSLQSSSDDGNLEIESEGLGSLIAFGTNVDGSELDGIANTADIVFESAKYTSGTVFEEGFFINKWFEVFRGDDMYVIHASRIHSFAGANFEEISKITIKDVMARPKIRLEKVFQSHFYADVIGRESSGVEAIKDIFTEQLGIDQDILTPIWVNEESGWVEAIAGDWKYDFTVDKKIDSKKLIEGLASVSPFIPRFDNLGNVKIDRILDRYDNFNVWSDTAIPFMDSAGDHPLNNSAGSEKHLINDSDVIDFSFSRTPIEGVYTKVVFKYNWNYGREDFDGSKTVYIQSFANDEVEPEDYQLPNFFDYSTNTWIYKHSYYGFTDNSNSTLVIDDDRGKYIRDSATAAKFAKWFLYQNCNQHLKMKVRLPITYMNLEIGDIVQFNRTVGDVKPYGIDYRVGTIQKVNGQTVFSHFMITSTNKTLEYCEIECMQMHNLTDEVFIDNIINPNDYDVASGVPIRAQINQAPYGSGVSIPPHYGCTDQDAWNYEAYATDDDGTCEYLPGDEPIEGCMDETACNYNSDATVDNSECVYVEAGWLDCDTLIVEGCMEEFDSNGNPMCNYNPYANTAATCNAGSECTDGTLECDPNDCPEVANPVEGCMDATMYNYNADANVPCDGCCEPFIPGCTDPNMYNYMPNANTDDGGCIPFIPGCMDDGNQPNSPEPGTPACNYDPDANTPWAEPTLCSIPPHCPTVVCHYTQYDEYDEEVPCGEFFASCGHHLGDISNPWNYCNWNPNPYAGDCDGVEGGSETWCCEFPPMLDNEYFPCGTVFGCMDEDAWQNFNPLAEVDDGSCVYLNEGCTIPGASNYDPDANFQCPTCCNWNYILPGWGLENLKWYFASGEIDKIPIITNYSGWGQSGILNPVLAEMFPNITRIGNVTNPDTHLQYYWLFEDVGVATIATMHQGTGHHTDFSNICFDESGEFRLCSEVEWPDDDTPHYFTLNKGEYYAIERDPETEEVTDKMIESILDWSGHARYADEE